MARAQGKKTGEVAKKPLKREGKTEIALREHWLADASLENVYPTQAFEKGERHLNFSARATCTKLQHPGIVRVELQLRAYLEGRGESLAMAEVLYAGVVELQQKEGGDAESVALLFPFARQALKGLLGLAGHEPPLPDKLNQLVGENSK